MKLLQVLLWIGALLLFLLLGSAWAADATVGWTHPTAWTDGQPLSAAQLERTDVEYGSCSGSGFGTVAGQQSAPAPATSTTIPGLAAGTYCFRARTITRSGAQSAWSAVASKTIPAAVPLPPVITVTISSAAYSLKSFPNGFMHLVRTGDVPVGIPCQLLPGELPWLGIAADQLAVCGPMPTA